MPKRKYEMRAHIIIICFLCWHTTYFAMQKWPAVYKQQDKSPMIQLHEIAQSETAQEKAQLEQLEQWKQQKPYVALALNAIPNEYFAKWFMEHRLNPEIASQPIQQASANFKRYPKKIQNAIIECAAKRSTQDDLPFIMPTSPEENIHNAIPYLLPLLQLPEQDMQKSIAYLLPGKYKEKALERFNTLPLITAWDHLTFARMYVREASELINDHKENIDKYVSLIKELTNQDIQEQNSEDPKFFKYSNDQKLENKAKELNNRLLEEIKQYTWSTDHFNAALDISLWFSLENLNQYEQAITALNVKNKIMFIMLQKNRDVARMIVSLTMTEAGIIGSNYGELH